MAIIRFDTDEISRAKNNIDSMISDCEKADAALKEQIKAINWYGEDNTVFQNNALSAVSNLEGLTQKLRTENSKLQNALSSYSCAYSTVMRLIGGLQ